MNPLLVSKAVGLVVGVLVYAVVFAGGLRLLDRRRFSWRTVAIATVLSAVIFALLQALTV